MRESTELLGPARHVISGTAEDTGDLGLVELGRGAERIRQYPQEPHGIRALAPGVLCQVEQRRMRGHSPLPDGESRQHRPQRQFERLCFFRENEFDSERNDPPIRHLEGHAT